MRLDLICASCGEAVRILADDRGGFALCPSCGHRFGVVWASDSDPIAARPRIDDDIVSWLTQSSDSSVPDSAGDATCQSCGYAGMIRGDAVCPVCRAVNVAQASPAPPTVDCPNCGKAIALIESDRGKTTICPSCKYFLGCIQPGPKHVYRKLGAKR
jgi:uncharacterized paraquat-inducible protein A